MAKAPKKMTPAQVVTEILQQYAAAGRRPSPEVISLLEKYSKSPNSVSRQFVQLYQVAQNTTENPFDPVGPSMSRN